MSGKNSCVFDIMKIEFGVCAATKTSSFENPISSLTQNIVTRMSFIVTQWVSTLDCVCCVYDSNREFKKKVRLMLKCLCARNLLYCIQEHQYFIST